MLNFSVFLPFNGNLTKIDENRENLCTFVPDNRKHFFVYSLEVYSL